MQINYKEITKEWLINNKIKNGKIIDSKYYVNNNGGKYYVDNKNVILNYSKKELEIAVLMAHLFKKNIYMMPKINIPEGIRTADYLLNGEYWDLKEINSNGKRVIDNRINGNQRQAKNYIFDTSNSTLSDDEIKLQVRRIYASNDRLWVNKIIIIRKNKLIAMYKRK